MFGTVKRFFSGEALTFNDVSVRSSSAA